MSDNKAYVIYMAILAAIPCVAISWEHYEKSSIQIEAIKAGLVQKIDPETKLPIWVKP